MELIEAIPIVRALADGLDPATNHPFPPDSPYQRPDVIRALYTVVQAVEGGKKTKAPRAVDPARPKLGAPWTPEEEEKLRAAFKSGTSVTDLAAAHGRTTGGITSRLVRMGLLEDTPDRRRALPGGGFTPPPAAPSPKRGLYETPPDSPF